MRIKSLYIENYKNIKKQTFDFSNNNGYIALIGLNGSGKSNLLEAISLIFGELYGIPGIKSVGKFWIKYSINEEDKFYGNIDENGNSIALEKHPNNLPSPVISCYSGEDLRLWTSIYKPYYTDFFNKAIRGASYKPDMIYIDRHCWKIALISLLYSENFEVKDFIKQLNIDSSLIKIKFTHKNIENIKSHDASNWYKRLSEKFGDAEININDMKDVDLNSTQYSTTLTNDQLIFYYLYFLSIPEKNTKDGMKADKLIEDISLKLGEIDFVDLSEGEKKMILITCITQILGDENSLVLLDEPDAHVHIDYKEKMLEEISAFKGQTIFTTHSPIMANQIQKVKKNNLFLLKEGKNIDVDAINKLSEISGEDIDFISSSVVVGSKYILVVEGISDVRCLTKAIKVLAKQNPIYEKLESIKLLSAGGSGDVKEIFTDVLLSQIDYIDKIVFLFDIDHAGKTGYGKIDALKKDNKYKQFASKIDAIYYNNNLNKNFELEDLFPEEAYRHIVNKLHSLKSYRDFKNRSEPVTSEIKDYIKNEVSSFQQNTWFEGFKPVLDKLLEVYYG